MRFEVYHTGRELSTTCEVVISKEDSNSISVAVELLMKSGFHSHLTFSIHVHTLLILNRVARPCWSLSLLTSGGRHTKPSTRRQSVAGHIERENNHSPSLLLKQ